MSGAQRDPQILHAVEPGQAFDRQRDAPGLYNKLIARGRRELQRRGIARAGLPRGVPRGGHPTGIESVDATMKESVFTY